MLSYAQSNGSEMIALGMQFIYILYELYVLYKIVSNLDFDTFIQQKLNFKFTTVKKFQMNCLNNSIKNLAIKSNIEPFVGRDEILLDINNHFINILNDNNNNAYRNPIMILHGPPGSLFISNYSVKIH